MKKLKVFGIYILLLSCIIAIISHTDPVTDPSHPAMDFHSNDTKSSIDHEKEYLEKIFSNRTDYVQVIKEQIFSNFYSAFVSKTLDMAYSLTTVSTYYSIVDVAFFIWKWLKWIIFLPYNNKQTFWDLYSNLENSKKVGDLRAFILVNSNKLIYASLFTYGCYHVVINMVTTKEEDALEEFKESLFLIPKYLQLFMVLYEDWDAPGPFRKTR